MGSCANKKNKGISMQLRAKITKVFDKIDINHSHSIDKAETLKFWQILHHSFNPRKSNFAKINTEALFKAVDFDKSGEITEAEWMAFWEIVKKSGHTEKEIDEELDQLSEGKAWLQLRKVDEFIKRDEKKRVSQVKIILEGEKRRFSQIQIQEQPEVKKVGERSSIESHKKETILDQDQKDPVPQNQDLYNNIQNIIIKPKKQDDKRNQDL